jgi:hypothetical protein
MFVNTCETVITALGAVRPVRAPGRLRLLERLRGPGGLRGLRLGPPALPPRAPPVAVI